MAMEATGANEMFRATSAQSLRVLSSSTLTVRVKAVRTFVFLREGIFGEESLQRLFFGFDGVVDRVLSLSQCRLRGRLLFCLLLLGALLGLRPNGDGRRERRKKLSRLQRIQEYNYNLLDQTEEATK